MAPHFLVQSEINKIQRERKKKERETDRERYEKESPKLQLV